MRTERLQAQFRILLLCQGYRGVARHLLHDLRKSRWRRRHRSRRRIQQTQQFRRHMRGMQRRLPIQSLLQVHCQRHNRFHRRERRCGVPHVHKKINIIRQKIPRAYALGIFLLFVRIIFKKRSFAVCAFYLVFFACIFDYDLAYGVPFFYRAGILDDKFFALS